MLKALSRVMFNMSNKKLLLNNTDVKGLMESGIFLKLERLFYTTFAFLFFFLSFFNAYLYFSNSYAKSLEKNFLFDLSKINIIHKNKNKCFSKLKFSKLRYKLFPSCL
ncbi:LOW QUALITY PROTEIN: hypothetical protein KUTeg_012462 [Tegillarca granosa]|uniref:ATP synthase F0 subunit 8 n=1 Tax=Tegillarca granosa TaxID=220873 RepID=A0ABQ9EZK8_TEGGR|nr:LOW QUALITY PROTEIN: hypothetical protein KUTeg_012462 [Tegillarca granosa]